MKSRKGFPGGSVVKNLPANSGDTGSFPGSGRSPGEGNGNSLQYFCLENPTDRGAWWATVHGVAEWNMTEATWHSLLIAKGTEEVWMGLWGSVTFFRGGSRLWTHTHIYMYAC